MKQTPCKFEVQRTGEFGIHSGRPRYRVVCTSCAEVVHENTTGPLSMMRDHEQERGLVVDSMALETHAHRPLRDNAT